MMKRLQIAVCPAWGRRVTTATNQTTRVKGEAESVQGKTRVLKAYVVPTLALLCILGVNFLSGFGISVDFAARAWSFAGDPDTRYPFEGNFAGNPSTVMATAERRLGPDACTAAGAQDKGLVNPVERVNRLLKTMIMAFLKDDHREFTPHRVPFRV